MITYTHTYIHTYLLQIHFLYMYVGTYVTDMYIISTIKLYGPETTGQHNGHFDHIKRLNLKVSKRRKGVVFRINIVIY
jgi:hypothetical protein